jgi:hypothetical protein
LVYGCSNLFSWNVNGSYQYSTVSAWQATGNGQNDISANPLFVNAAGSDFLLQPGSPAIGAGVYLPNFSTSNPPDIGAK